MSSNEIEIGLVYLHKPLNQTMVVYKKDGDRIFASFYDEGADDYVRKDYEAKDFMQCPTEDEKSALSQ